MPLHAYLSLSKSGGLRCCPVPKAWYGGERGGVGGVKETEIPCLYSQIEAKKRVGQMDTGRPHPLTFEAKVDDKRGNHPPSHAWSKAARKGGGIGGVKWRGAVA